MPGLDIQRGVERFCDQFSDGRNKIQLFVGGVLEEKLLRAGHTLVDEHMGARSNGLFVHSQVQLFGQRGGAEPELLPGLELQRIVDHDVGKLFEAWIGHQPSSGGNRGSYCRPNSISSSICS